MRIDSLLPSWLSRRLAGRDTMQRVVDNASWLFLDQVVRMGLGLFTGVWIARYLGPEQYGWLSYATALVGTVSAIASMGINAIVVRELARAPEEAKAWTSAAFRLKLIGSALGFLVCLGIAGAHQGVTDTVRPLIVVVALGMVFQTLDVIDLLFQSRAEARVAAWVRMAVVTGVSGLKVALILGHASVVALAVTGVVEIALCGAGWMVMARVRRVPLEFVRTEGALMGRLWRESWPLGVSGLAIYAQAYADQLVIGNWLGAAELGQYAAAMRLVTAFGFLPMIVYTVAAPEITRAKRDDAFLYHRRLFDLYRVMGALFLVTLVGLLLAGAFAARSLLGLAYLEAAALLPLLAFRLFFTNFGVARGAFLANEGLLRFGLVTAVVGAAVNLGLNFWLVPRLGVRGAIVASMASFFVTTFALEALHPRARINLGLMLRAVFLPWRAPVR